MTLRFRPEGDISGGLDAAPSAPETRVCARETVRGMTGDSRIAAISIFCPDHIAGTVARLEAEGLPENVSAYLRYVQMVRTAHHARGFTGQPGNIDK